MKKFVKVSCVMLVIIFLASPSFAMTDNQKLLCHGIIHASAGTASGLAAGLAQIPLSDNLALAGIIGGMTIGLAEVFDISLAQESVETIGLSVLSYFGGVVAVRSVSQILAGWLPFAGNTLNAMSAGGLIEYIGWEMAEAFDSGNWAIGKIAVSVGSVIAGSKVPAPKKAANN